jgi:hypothetical protein
MINAKGRGSIKFLKHTSRGSKLIDKLLHLDVHVHVTCSLHMYFNSNIHACVMYARNNTCG